MQRQVLLRFNTFFKVVARPHTDAEKKRMLHELAAYAPPATRRRVATERLRPCIDGPGTT